MVRGISPRRIICVGVPHLAPFLTHFWGRYHEVTGGATRENHQPRDLKAGPSPSFTDERALNRLRRQLPASGEPSALLASNPFLTNILLHGQTGFFVRKSPREHGQKGSFSNRRQSSLRSPAGRIWACRRDFGWYGHDAPYQERVPPLGRVRRKHRYLRDLWGIICPRWCVGLV